MKHKFLNLLLAFFILMPLVGCAKENPGSLVVASQASSKGAYQQILEERESNFTKKPNDPSVCKKNPQGYLYFKIGSELFRTTKNSSIHIESVVPDHLRQHQKLETDTPEGCEGNPYIYPDVFIKIRHKQNDPDWQKLTFDGFLITLHDANDVKYVNQAQRFNEKDFDSFKYDTSKLCDKILENFERCGWKDKSGGMAWPRIYKSTSYSIDGHPFILNCGPYVNGSRCQSVYQLYPGVYLNYKIIPKENKNWDEKNIILFDQYIRNTFELIRIKN